MFAFGPSRPRRRPSLTAMIDVVFLLLIFFMLASRFGQPQTLPLTAGGAGGAWTGPPRLVEVGAGGALRLNGVPLAPASLTEALAPLMAGPDDPVVIRPLPEARLQDLAEVLDRMRGGGLTRPLVVP